MSTMTITHNLGFPRIGARRELKFALERHWKGDASAQELAALAAQLRARHWQQQAIGLLGKRDRAELRRAAWAA